MMTAENTAPCRKQIQHCQRERPACTDIVTHRERGKHTKHNERLYRRSKHRDQDDDERTRVHRGGLHDGVDHARAPTRGPPDSRHAEFAHTPVRADDSPGNQACRATATVGMRMLRSKGRGYVPVDNTFVTREEAKNEMDMISGIAAIPGWIW